MVWWCGLWCGFNCNCNRNYQSHDMTSRPLFTGGDLLTILIHHVQQNPKCKQFLLVATGQAPENHGCALCCGLSTPNPLVVFPLGQFARGYLGSSDLAPIFGLESVGHVGPLQHVLSRVLAVRVETERHSCAGTVPNHESSNGFSCGVFRKKRMYAGQSSKS